jgi:hypothetical protein
MVHPPELSKHAKRMIKRPTLIAIGYVVAAAPIALVANAALFQSMDFLPETKTALFNFDGCAPWRASPITLFAPSTLS